MTMGLGRLRRINTMSKTTSSTSSSTPECPPVTTGYPPPANAPTTTTAQQQSRKPSNTAAKGLRRRSIYVIETDDPNSPPVTGDKPVPPDGGYGWVIVIAVHFIQAMGMGFLTSLGIFFIEWRKDFGSSAAQTSLVTALSSVTIGLISRCSSS